MFLCLDYLYDSRLPRDAREVSTAGLRNQFGLPVGEAEVAALNHAISTHAPDGSSGSAVTDAALALLAREVMGDGRRADGPDGASALQVYPGPLHVGEPVQPPRDGSGADVLRRAQSIWAQASLRRGPVTLSIARTGVPDGTATVPVGRPVAFRISAIAGSGASLGGLALTVRCRGPVTCPRSLVSRPGGVVLRLRPTRPGRIALAVQALVPAADGLLSVDPDWRTHEGPVAGRHGRQRGWIARRVSTRVRAGIEVVSIPWEPSVTTLALPRTARPGATLVDVVTVADVPPDVDLRVVGTLYGPFPSPPRPTDCRPAHRVGTVTLRLDGAGTLRTPGLVADRPGHYTWVQHLPAQRRGPTPVAEVRTPCGLPEETTLVEPFTPQVATRASRPVVRAGETVHDVITVQGLGHARARLRWWLAGPVPPVDGGCAGVAWHDVLVHARGEMAVDGALATAPVLRSAPLRLELPGCYSFGHELEPSALSTAHRADPGIPAETVLVTPRRLAVETRISERAVLVGREVQDRIRLRGGRIPARATAAWTLVGPVSPGAVGCRGAVWDGAALRATGRLVLREGAGVTAPVRLDRPGCYSYAVDVEAGPTYEVLDSPVGLVVETVEVTRPVVPLLPDVPTGTPGPRAGVAPGAGRIVPLGRPQPSDRPDTAPTPGPRVPPRRFVPADLAAPAPVLPGTDRARGVLVLPGADPLRVVPTRVVDGVVAVPRAVDEVGWLAASARPGDLTGAALLLAHVSDGAHGPGAFAGLADLRPGQRVVWDGAVYEIEHRAVRPRRAGLPATVLRTDGPPRLHLVTCAHRVRRGDADFYRDNLIVTATLVRGGRGAAAVGAGD
ncbi:sortase domain-bontaining protein [Nocardioides sp.]|uniref:sortase domain-bontaining protein n=1 Tax=Nocardioides sp. TaxID=35761 RepID=UPI00351512C8